MTTYAIGDIQGCYEGFSRLLERLRFDPSSDRLWLVGDLVNRGGQSLEVLRLVYRLRGQVVAVLGNHDLALLLRADKASRRPNPELDCVIDAPDAGELLAWLRCRPLLHVDRELGWALAHAGIHPSWDLPEAERLARKAEDCIRDDTRALVLDDAGQDSGRSEDPRRFALAAFTRMRFLAGDGRLAAGESGPPGSQPHGLVPWFDWPGRRPLPVGVVFGHWAALGLYRQAGILALDSGYVWGGALSAVPLERPTETVQEPNPARAER